MRKDSVKNSNGFTMMELLVTMGIFFVLVAAAGPAISNWVIKNRVDTAVVSFRGALNYARYEALNRNSWITVRPNNTSWSTGWYVFTDEGNDGFMGSGDEVLRADILNVVGLTVEWARDMPRISYGPRGLTNGGSQNSVRYCVEGDTNHGFAKGLVMSSIGRTRMVKGAEVGCTP